MRRHTLLIHLWKALQSSDKRIGYSECAQNSAHQPRNEQNYFWEGNENKNDHQVGD